MGVPQEINVSFATAHEPSTAAPFFSHAPLRERLLDLVLLLVLSPILLLVGAAIAAAVYLDSPGSVIFRVSRIGRGGRPFRMLKFRKMRRDAAGAPLTLADDARFTPIGRFLADTRLDELPQIWNVICGDMRLVGPRPEEALFVAEFSDQYAEILRAAPGMTGPAQLRFINEKSTYADDDPVAAYRSRILPQKILIDIDYVRSRSLRHDLWILAQTCWLPLRLLVHRLRKHRMALWASLPVGLVATLLVVLLLVSSGNIA